MSEPRLQLLRQAINAYAPLTETTWQQLKSACRTRSIPRSENLVPFGSTTQSLYFVCSGLFRSFTVSADGKEYNKHFFPENTFPASIRTLLTGEPSAFALQALEDSTVIEIDHRAYRKLLRDHDDLKWYHIQYLEKNWVLDKEPIEVALAIDDARTRYLRFIEANPGLASRIPLHHIASRIGVTPTQLSRIRKSLTT
ncbi:cyclic nucleotide-binding domain protein [Verrucomicrobiia bacterium DG1235]|nr:cyclic nucleotide-binding domain protein [Verrucomicrobiae bacterium DG1235]